MSLRPCHDRHQVSPTTCSICRFYRDSPFHHQLWLCSGPCCDLSGAATAVADVIGGVNIKVIMEKAGRIDRPILPKHTAEAVMSNFMKADRVISQAQLRSQSQLPAQLPIQSPARSPIQSLIQSSVPSTLLPKLQSSQPRSIPLRPGNCPFLGEPVQPPGERTDAQGRVCNCQGSWLMRCEKHEICCISLERIGASKCCQKCEDYPLEWNGQQWIEREESSDRRDNQVNKSII